MSDDDAIREFRTRLLAGRFGDRELLMPPEADYSGMWSALVEHIPAWEQRFGFDHPVVHEVRTAVNTTEYGREKTA